MSDKSFKVIGISDSCQQYFNDDVRKIISAGKVFSGGKRHHQLVESLLPDDAVWIDVTVPLEKVFEQYQPYSEIVVFASGDPLFYGFAVTLQHRFENAHIETYPSFNSLQLLAHRLLLPYAEMINVSLTGRPWKNLDVVLIEGRGLVGVLTDKTKTPAEIARRMLDYGYSNYMMSVGERLGNESEQVRTMSLQAAAECSFDNPNCVILQRTSIRQRYFGIHEQKFSHLDGRSNMITKMPIRLLSLAELDLYERSVMWDIGFCTGSVSIEAKLQFPQLDIIAFERREESRKLLEDNCRKFGAPGIEGVIADFMECDLSQYPRPDAVFIGGHGGKLGEMIKRVYDYINPGGVIVFNSVSAESCKEFKDTINKYGQIVSEHVLTLDEHNPITIIKAI
jgi:precorrin-6Y C5,15-methyltransferase (decarboxylating)